MIAPILDDLAEQFEGKLKVTKLNVDDHKETAAKFNVRGIPTLILFKNGAAHATKVGAVSKPQLVEFINAALWFVEGHRKMAQFVFALSDICRYTQPHLMFVPPRITFSIPLNQTNKP